MFLRTLSLFFILQFCFLSSVRANEHVPAIELTHLSPQGGQAGTTVEVTISGVDIEGLAGLVFNNPAITCAPKMNPQGKPVPNVMLVTLPKDLKPGRYEARVRGKFGLSNPRWFCVGTWPETSFPAAGATQDKATPLAVNSVVNSATNGSNRSWFKFHVVAKERVYITLQLPDTKLEPQLAVFDAEGHSLMRCNPSAPVEFTAPAEADYFIELHDLLYRGGPDCRYRLVLSSERPPIERTDDMVSCYTDDAELQRILSLAPKSSETIPQNMPLTPPCEYVSLFPTAGAPATFTFSAKKGAVLWIEVVSHRLGVSSDPELVLEKVEKNGSEEKSTFIAEAPDMTLSKCAEGFGLSIRDGVIKFEAKEDGDYRLLLRDLFNTAPSSPRLPYKLSLRHETPDFQLVAVRDDFPHPGPGGPGLVTILLTPTLWRGGNTSMRIFVQRQDGFAGEISVKAEGLPPGVTCAGAVLGPGDEAASLVFHAADDAKPWAGQVKITGTAKINGADVTRAARTATPIWNVQDMRNMPIFSRLTESIGLSVIDQEAPMLVEPENPVVETTPKGKFSVKYKVTRRGGYEPLVKVRAFTLGQFDKSFQRELEIPAKATEVSFEFDLPSHTPTTPLSGEHTFVLQGCVERVKIKKNAEDIPAAEAEAKKCVEQAAAAADVLKKAQDALNAAKQKSQEAETKLKQAPEAEKAAAEAAAKTAKEALAAAEKEAKDADAKSRAAAQAKTDAEKAKTELIKQAEPREMTYILYSAPVRVKINPEPPKEPAKK